MPQILPQGTNAFLDTRSYDEASRADQALNPVADMTVPIIQVSWGELIDKMTILEIKEQRLKSTEALANVRRELATLVNVAQDILMQRSDLACIKKELKSVNEALWDIEDQIRAKEAAKSFDQQFIDLARSVYLNNDKRGNLKRQISALLDSELVEEKQYTPYSA